MAHEQVEDGIDRGAAVRLRVDLPARMVAREKQAGTEESEESTAVGPIVALARRKDFNQGEGLLEETDAVAVGSGIVRAEFSAVLDKPEFRRFLRGKLPRGAENFSAAA